MKETIPGTFETRHIGPDAAATEEMLRAIDEAKGLNE